MEPIHNVMSHYAAVRKMKERKGKGESLWTDMKWFLGNAVSKAKCKENI